MWYVNSSLWPNTDVSCQRHDFSSASFISLLTLCVLFKRTLFHICKRVMVAFIKHHKICSIVLFQCCVYCLSNPSLFFPSSYFPYLLSIGVERIKAFIKWWSMVITNFSKQTHAFLANAISQSCCVIVKSLDFTKHLLFIEWDISFCCSDILLHFLFNYNK